MTCEVRSRVSNGQGNVARNVQTVHSLPPCFSSPHSCPPLSVSSIYLWQPDVFSGSFIYALFHQRGIPAAKCHGKLSLKIRNEFISLSFSPFPPLLSFLSSECLPRSSLFSPCMQSCKRSRAQLTGKNGKHLHTELRWKNKRTIPWSLLFFLCMKWGLSISEGEHDVLCLWVWKRRRTKWFFCCMKCTIISNRIELWH